MQKLNNKYYLEVPCIAGLLPLILGGNGLEGGILAFTSFVTAAFV